MSDPIRVLIADDHPVVRQGLRGFLETYADITVIAEADNGAQAVALALEHVPDVILMDLLMPEMDGVEAIEQVVASSPATRIIVLTSYTEDEYLLPAMRAGAVGYQLKDADPEDLVSAIRATARGSAPFPEKTRRRHEPNPGDHRSRAAKTVQGLASTSGCDALAPRTTHTLRVTSPGENLFDEEYAEGLSDLDGFSHIILICHLHKTSAFKLKVVPYLDTELRGLFATRAPSRPNPIGLSVVRLLEIDGRRLRIEGVDLLDGTPVLDIKPYVRDFDDETDIRCGWLDEVKGRDVAADARFQR